MLQILLISFYAVLLFFLLDFYRRKSGIQLESRFFYSFYILKLSMAFALTALYTYYYTDRANADIYKFFDDSLVIHQIAQTDFTVYLKLLFGWPISSEAHNLILDTQHWDASSVWGNTGSRLITRIHLLMHWISFSNVWVHAIVFNALSVLGFMWIFKSLSAYFHRPKWLFMAFLMPSVLFWSSGMLKEAVLVFFIGSMFYAFHLFNNKGKKAIGTLIFLLACCFVLLLKAYLLLLMAPFILGWAIWRFIPVLRQRSPLFSLLLALPLIFFLLNIISQYVFQYSFLELLLMRYNDFLLLALRENAGSLLALNEYSLNEFWQWMGAAFFHTWCIPWLWQSGGFLIKLAGLEHLLLILVLAISAFILLKNRHLYAQFHHFSFFLIFTILLFQFIGLTVPVLGAIVRYKMPGILFVFITISFVFDKFYSKK